MGDLEATLLTKLNAERASGGLAALALQPWASSVARAHSQEMAGARDICAEWVAEDAALRGLARSVAARHCVLRSDVVAARRGERRRPIDLNQGGFDDSYGMAIPGATLRDFLGKNVPKFNPDDAAAEKVKRTGVPFRFNPMNSRERRVIHLSLRNETEVRSESTGFGGHRQVVIYPAGMASLPEEPPPPRSHNMGRPMGRGPSRTQTRGRS